jgi:L-iditol 2-dehydrogenase
MKAVQLTGIRQTELCEIDAPSIQGDSDVLIDVAVVGVCGSDVHYFNEGGIGAMRLVEYPWVIGHECAGTIAAVGSAVTDLTVGDRVAVDPLIWCGHCDQCLAGRENTCRNQRFLGNPGETGGALVEQLVMPAASCVKIPDSMSFVEAAICEPLAIGEHARRLAELGPGAAVAILGAGPIGLSVLLALRAAGAGKIYVTDLLPPRLEMAGDLGADWVGSPNEVDVVATVMAAEPLGVEAVFECAGVPETVEQGVGMLAPAGRLLLLGIPETTHVSINIDIARRREHVVQMVRRQNHAAEAAIELVAGGVDAARMATHHFSLAQTQDALETVTQYRDGVVKAIVHVQEK